MSSAEPSESSSDIKKRVIAAREFMKQRCKETDKEYNGSVISAHLFKNADMTSAQIRRYCKMTDEANALLAAAYEKLQLSGRGHDRILRVAKNHCRHVSEYNNRKGTHRRSNTPPYA